MIRKLAPRSIGLALACASVLALAACSDDSFDPNSQVGPNPTLPEPQQYLFPPMHLASVVGWNEGETPTVAPGLKIEVALPMPLDAPVMTTTAGPSTLRCLLMALQGQLHAC